MFGPAIKIPENSDKIKDISFRVINDFIPSKDTLLTRIDIKIKDKHFVVAFNSTRNEDCDLVVPLKAVEGALGVKTSKDELINSLEELLNHLKNDI